MLGAGRWALGGRWAFASRRLLAAFALVCACARTGVAAEALLADAAQKQDGAAVRRLLDARAEVNAAQPDGTTALHWAAYHEDAGLVDRLITAGASVAAVNRYGVTPLTIACLNGNLAVVDRLLTAGADANTSMPGGETVLMTAARTGRAGVVRALLTRGAQVNAREPRGQQTALMWAAAEGHADVVSLLIEAGGDFKTPLDSGFSPMLFAVREGRIPVVKVLLKAGADVNEVVRVRSPARLPSEARPVRAGTTPLHLAVQNAHFELAAVLLDAGADPNATQLGYTPLHVMVRTRNPGIGDNEPGPQGSGSMTSLELVKRLVAAGANVDARMTRRPNLTNTRFHEIGATPFLLAAVAADLDLMKTLVALGADPKATNEEGSTALMAAAGLGTRSPGEDAGTEDEVVEALGWLLEQGLDINAVDSNGETAMHGAAYKNLPKAVKFLASKGAEIGIWNRQNAFGWRPITIARGYRFGNFKPSDVTMAAVEEVMLSAGVRPPTPEEEQAKGYDIYAPPPQRSK